jgi:hypothetical protein
MALVLTIRTVHWSDQTLSVQAVVASSIEAAGVGGLHLLV